MEEEGLFGNQLRLERKLAAFMSSSPPLVISNKDT